MKLRDFGTDGDKALEQVLGYLNFSSGAADPQVLSNLNLLYEFIEGARGRKSKQATWRTVRELLTQGLSRLSKMSPAFQDSQQAQAMLNLIFDRFLDDYREFHRDLLFHQSDQYLFGPFFLGRVFEGCLKHGPPWDEVDRICNSTLNSLNDYIGYRPVAVLEGHKIEPYPHEWLRPIPLYVRDAGVAVGPQQEVVEKALELLQNTEEDLLRAAYFAPDHLDELAVDPRAYDFDHPVNKRPNYHFGLWDPHCIDNRGFYRRFVVQQVTLDALMHRVEHPPRSIPIEEVVFEAAAVLAGTVLMASGISGSGPETFDSSVSLTTLLPDIAQYRDAFYERLFRDMTGAHAKRLKKEALEKRQPFGGARQHLNAQLARKRASQLEHVHLAMIFGRMGYPEAATRQVNVVPVASARMRCRIDCLIAEGLQDINKKNLQQAEMHGKKMMEQVHRAIQCGAMIDPWNILGFDAHFSLFPALENSIHDHRADELIDLMDQIYAYYSRVWREAAACDENTICDQVQRQFKETTEWWRQFAAHEVSNVEASDALDAYQAAEHVSEALNLWHRGGASAGDVAFWAKHAAMFDSGMAYALVVEALLERQDYVGSMALLIHWLSQAERVGLEQAEQTDHSFHALVESWLGSLQHSINDENAQEHYGDELWKLVKKFFDYLEANADDFWRAPQFEVASAKQSNSDSVFDDQGMEEDEGEGLYGAAYEDVVYKDSTDDGIDGELFDTGEASDDELEREARRIADRLAFLATIARLWTTIATGPMLRHLHDNSTDSEEQSDEVISHWVVQAFTNHRDLLKLLDAVKVHPIPKPAGDHDSLIQYDRRRLTKETILDRIISTCVETSAAVRHLLASASAYPVTTGTNLGAPDRDEDELQAVTVFACMLRGEVDGVRLHWPDLIQALSEKALLYVPLTKGGEPRKIVSTRVRQQTILDLLAWLPRLGLLTETRQLLDTSRDMERNHPVGPGAVTEYDELFKIGYKGLVQCLVSSAPSWDENDDEPNSTSQLVDCLEHATESLLASWLEHSKTLRLSVLEKVKRKAAWQELVAFIERYGEDLFTQKFFNLGNLRGILHQGVDVWLAQLEEEPPDDAVIDLLDDLDDSLPREDAVEHLTLVLEAIVENYGEYRDYNSTTTQSDRGQLLYMLLDFLRLRTDYDRVAWNLKPVVWAHEILVRQGHKEAAKMWRRSLSERISNEADKYLARLSRLQKKYAMRMPTVADRLGERFIRPMQVDRIRALIEPAIQAAERGETCDEFEVLESETDSLTREPTGVGLDVPIWLMALEDEVDDVQRPAHLANGQSTASVIPQVNVPLEEIRRQINEWVKHD